MAPKKTKTPVALLPAPSPALSFWLRLKRMATPMHLLFVGVIVYLLATIAFTAAFFVPRSLQFSFADNNCFTSPVLLPNLVAKRQGNSFEATTTKGISLAGYPLYSHTTCVEPTKVPAEHLTDQLSFSPLGLGFLQKKISVSSGTLPKVSYSAVLSKPVSIKEPLVFPLDKGDRFFDYRLVVKDKQLDCDNQVTAIKCDVSQLGLKQSVNYAFAMERVFEGRPDKNVLFTKTAPTVGAVLITKSSIGRDQVIFSAPKEIKLDANKLIKSFEGIELNLITDKGRQKLAVTTSANKRTLTIKLGKPLARDALFELRVASVTASDGGHLPETFVMRFKTSGGPKVRGVSIGSYKVSTDATVTVYFDTAVSGTQKLNDFIRLQIGGKTVPATVSRSGSAAVISPAESLPRCTHFSVKVLDGLANAYGITGGSAWQYNSRTICQKVFSIGTSIQGRSILAYSFKKGGSYVLYVGGVHGNEKSSVYTLNSWIDYLERNYDSLPAHRSIVVIPNLNPDAFAVNSRTNARNVDLNRNFPANNWKRGVTMPGGSYNPNGGGAYPLSEPESKALADYTLGLGPRLVLTHHAAAGVVMPNDSDDSDALARIYDEKSNLYYEPNSQTGQIFTYDTTGAYEDWLHDKHDIPALLIEHWTMSSNEFYKNSLAMWHMATLP